MRNRTAWAIAALAILSFMTGTADASNLYWSANGSTLGGAGTWDTSNTRWGSAASGPFSTAWNNANTDVARFGGTAGGVTNASGITVGGLWFDTTGYVITNAAGNALTFGAANNTITLNNVAAATIRGPITGSGNVTLTTPNPATAGTVTFDVNTGNGWSGTTTVNPGMTLSLATSTSPTLANTTEIIINSGIILSARNGANPQNQVSDTAPITFTSGGTFQQVNSIGGSFTETIGAVTVASGQANLVFQNGSSGNGVVTTLGGMTQAVSTAAITFSSPNTAQVNFKVTGASDTPANEVIGPWATFGSTAAAQTDYAIYSSGNGTVAARNITASAQSTWSTTHALDSNYTLTLPAGTATQLTSTRSINTLRNTAGAAQNITSIAANVLTVTGSSYANGDVVVTGNTIPTGLAKDTVYYVVNASGATFQLAATPGGTAIAGLTHVANSPLTGGIRLSSGNNLETYGILNGSSTTLPIGGATGAGFLTTPTGGGNLFLTTGAGSIVINAPITNASDNAAVTVVKSGTTGRLVLSGNNTFTGGLVVNAGVTANSVRLAGTQSFTGGITLNGGGIGENSANATPTTPVAALNGNAITVNGPAHLVLEPGTLSTTSTITINSTGVLTFGPSSGAALNVPGLVSGSGVLDVNPSSGNYSGSSVNLTHSANPFSGNVIYGSTQGQPYVLNVNSIGDSGKVIFGFAGGNSTFALNSTASSGLTFNTRQFELVGAASANNLPKIGNNSPQAFTISTDLLATGTGARTLQLQGTGAGLSTFGGKLTDGSLTSLAITKAESGTWILTGTNTYTGTTTISSGILQIGNGGTVGSISSNSAISISSGATLRFNRSDTLTQGDDFKSVISGAGNLVQAGGGTLVLNGTNTFTGTTTISAGKILMTNPLALQNSAYNTTGSNGSTIGLDVTSGLSSGTLTLGGLSGSVNLASAFTAGYASSVTTLTLNPQTGVTFTYSGAINDATTGMTVTKNGAGTQLLHGNNAYTGGTILNAGAIEINNANSLGSGTITFAGTATIQPTHSSYPTLANGIQVNPGAVGTLYVDNQFFSMTFTGPVTGSGTLIQLNGGGGATGSVTLSSPANTFTGILQLAAPNGKTSSLTVNSLADSANPIRFTSSTATAAGNNFILGAGTATPLLFNSRQIELASATGTAGIYNNNGNNLNTITINTSLLITANGAKTLLLGGSNTGANTFAGTIGNSGAGVTAITKADGGRWILSNTANSYTGITTVSGGILQVSTLSDGLNNSSIGASANVAGNLILNGGTLQYTGGAQNTDRLFSLQVSSSLDASGTGAVNFNNTGSMGFNGGTAAKVLTLTGTNTGNNTLAAAIANNTGTTSISKTGIGTWVLSGTNSATGTSSLSGGGTLVLDYTAASTSRLPTGALTLQNGGGNIILRGGSYAQSVASLTIGSSPSPTGGHTSITRDGGSAKLAFGAINRLQSAGSTLSLAENSLATTTSAVFNGILGGGITVGSNWAKVSSGDIVALTSSDYTDLTPTAPASLSGTVNYQVTGSVSRAVGNINSLRIVGDGNDQVLTISSGNLAPSVVGGTGNTFGNSGGILYAGGGNNSYTITGAGNIQAQNGNQELIINTYTGTLTVDMAVTTGSSAAGLTKVGAGTLILTKAGTYSGATFVNQGTLQLKNSSAIGTSTGTAANGIYVANGAAVEFAGGINIGAEAITATGDGVSGNGALRNYSGTNTYGGAITVGTGGTRINSSAGLLVLNNTVTTSLNNNLTIGGAGSVTISNVVSGVGGLIKDGAGTLTLTANNTYSGATLINEGTLAGVVGGSCSNSAVTVASAGALGINVTDNNKKWTCASLAMNNGSQFKFDFTGTPSTSIAPLNILGTLSFSGTPTIVVTPGNIVFGTYPLLTVGGSAPLSVVPTLTGVNGSLAWIGNTLWLTIAPAPTLIRFF
jgi:fibronectin-binding autotransporter adhesin